MSKLNPLLTIAVPTYNRCSHLRFLLGVLERDLKGLEDQVLIFISDNASTDETPEVLAEFEKRLSNLQFRRNPINTGPDENICSCYQLPETPYVWILGDDDAPLSGALPLIVALLKQETPDMMYLTNLPTVDIEKDYKNHCLMQLGAIQTNREDFASALHIQFTFISSMILRKCDITDRAVNYALNITRHSYLIQLAWAFETLKLGSKFYICREYSLIATVANSGGYSPFEVFLVNHTRIASLLLSDYPAVLRNLLNKTSICYLPGLIWQVRKGSIGKFSMQNREEILVPEELSRTHGFRWLVTPIWTRPMPLAMVAYFVARISAFLIRKYQYRVILPRSKEVVAK